MLNGVPVKRLDGGDRGLIWRGMTIRSIERIEIIRGPGSAVYGADAFAGVINIITKTADDIAQNSIGGNIGSFNTQEVWGIYGHQGDDYAIAGSITYLQSDGHEAIVDADGQTLLDQLFNTDASHAPGPVNTQQRRVDAHLDLSIGHWRLLSTYQGQFDVGMGVGFDYVLDTNAELQDKRLNTQLSYQNPDWSENWEVSTQLTYTNARSRSNNIEVYPPGAILPSPLSPAGFEFYPEGVLVTANYAEEHVFFDSSAFYKGFDRHLIRIGAGYGNQDLYKVRYATNRGSDAQGNFIFAADGLVDLTDTPVAVYPEEIRESWYAFIQDAWTLTDHWELTAGIRYDHYSDFGSTTNPRLVLVWQTSAELTTKLLYGRAFRAPSFRELYLRNNENSLGNPDLKPEIMDNWELAFDWQPTDNTRFALNLYRYSVEDKILIDLTNSSTGRILNGDNWEGEGVEFESQWRISNDWLIKLNYTYAASEDNGSPVGFYPRQQLYLQADWQFALGWEWVNQMRRLSDWRRTAGDDRPQLAGQVLFDTTLHYQGRNWDVTLGVRNLLDEDARSATISRVPNDIPLPGRSGFVQVEYRF